MSNELTQFLRDRLDERDAIARAAGERRGGPAWAARDNEDWPSTVTGITRTGVIVDVVEPNDIETVKHIAANDPARVLREVEAKRAVLAMYCAAVTEREELAHLIQKTRAAGWDTINVELEEASAIHKRDALLKVLRLLAAAYSDHPDYREEWKP